MGGGGGDSSSNGPLRTPWYHRMKHIKEMMYVVYNTIHVLIALISQNSKLEVLIDTQKFNTYNKIECFILNGQVTSPFTGGHFLSNGTKRC